MQEIVVADTWSDRVEDLLARIRENRLLLICVGAVVAGSLVVWARPPAARIAPPARASSAPVAAASASASAPVVVHVAGAVHRPGLYEFPAGARIADAIETAGGALRAADLSALNLAEPLTDGIQVLVPERGSATDVPVTPAAGASTGPSVSINSGDVAELETIPGVGPVTATAIVYHRTQVGSFTSVDELLDVDGIGPATLEAIRPYVTL